MEKHSVFPDPSLADKHGLLCISEEITVGLLLDAYQHGIFPWPVSEDYSVTWFSPPERLVLFTSDFTPPRRLLKKMRNAEFTFRLNDDFERVISECRIRKEETWITKEMVRSYCELFESNNAYSIECFKNNELAGGLYGVNIGDFVSGESMFFRQTDASKASLVILFQVLRSLNLSWCDCQVETPLLSSFGAKLLPRSEFLELSKPCFRNSLRSPLAELKNILVEYEY